MKKIILFFISVILITSCDFETGNQSVLSSADKKLCDSLKLDSTIVIELKQNTKSKIEPFHYSLSRMINKDGSETELDPIRPEGIVFEETAANTELLLEKLQPGFKTKGYTLFIVDRNYGIENKPDVMGILKTTDKYTVLKQIQTNGINYDIDNDSLISIVKTFDTKYGLELVGASGDWCEFKIIKIPTDWDVFAKEAYEVCPDIVDQGAGSVEDLAKEMKRTGRLFFWWD